MNSYLVFLELATKLDNAAPAAIEIMTKAKVEIFPAAPLGQYDQK